ncbi:hypothetical protein CK203_115681 [Vitis vinifera]|uniref:Uncharacterized protein n=1 Tax=Vitis vinifera TaxID=29760 RepID=A0A438CPL6_VITVI|nr:hypothetical protein CK203_115681 [Vitis vinifera]
MRQFSQLGMSLSRAFQNLVKGGLLIALASRPPPQPMPSQFRLNLHYAYHQGPGHDTDHVRHGDTFAPFILWPEDVDVQVMTRSGMIAQVAPLVTRPFGGTDSLKEVKREDDEILRQLATCIVFSTDDLQSKGFDHTCPLYITVVCSSHRVLSVLLDNGSTLNVCPLATTVALGFSPLDFGPSTQIVRAYDNAQRKVGVIPSSLHQKVKFIHDRKVITIQSTRDIISSFEPVLQNSHGDDDLLLTGFTFDEDDAYMDLGQDEGSILFGIPFNYVVCPYTFSLADYFVRGSEIQPSVEEMGIDDSTVDEL